VREFDVKFKGKVVREYLAGKGGYKLLAAKFGIAESMVRRWMAAYRHHGNAGLIRQRGAYTLEFKLEVVHRGVAENLSCRELAAIYNIGNPHSITMWQQQKARGELRSLKGMRPSGQDVSVPAKKKTSNQSLEAPRSEESDQLLRENQQLRAEVAYLKKFNALVLAKKLARQKEPK
jgi:transposase